MKVLIVEDELIPANYLKKVLTTHGYEVLPLVDRGQHAISVAKKEKPHVILMDVMLKDHVSGCDAALEIHRNNPEILIVFLTAYSDKEMIDFAVESKAFGYLLKPYRDKEILATLKLAESQLNSPQKETQIDLDDTLIQLADGYSFDKQHHSLHKDGQEVYCGPKSLKLIAFLCEHRHHTVTIDDIMMHLWDMPKSQQTLRSLIHRIRENTSSNLIKNINKIGYKIGLKD